jgi:hypothetical protein
MFGCATERLKRPCGFPAPARRSEIDREIAERCFGHAGVSLAAAAGETSGAITGSTGVPACDISGFGWRHRARERRAFFQWPPDA